MPLGKQEQYARQDRLFGALERLEQKETQAAAFQELLRIVKDLDAANLSTLLHAAGTQTTKTTQFARVHSLRLAALCTEQQHCLQWRAMLQQPLLAKLLGLLSRSLRDGDSAVRAAACDGFGVVAQQLALAYPPGSELTSGGPSNPLLACILDALGEPGAAVQAAAACALAQTVDHLQPLDAALLQQLLRALNNPLFLGRADLWPAFARLEDGRVCGLVASACQHVLAAMPEVLGSAQEGTGLCGAVSSRGKDFQLRVSAAHTLKALAVGIGPLHPVGWDVAVAAIKAAKTDISKPVRDAAMAALPVVAGLQEFLASGALPEEWPAVSSSLLAAAGGKSKRGVAGVKSKAAAAKAVAVDEPSNAQYIPALHGSSAGIGFAGSSPGYSMPPGPTLPAMPAMPAMPAFGALPAPNNTYYGAHAPPLGAGGPVVGAGMHAAYAPQPLAPAPAPAQAHEPISGAQLAAQLAAIQEQQALMAGVLTTFTASTQGTLQQLQQHMASVSAGMAALAGSMAPSQQQAQLQQHLASVHAGMAALAVGMGGVQQVQRQLATVSDGLEALAMSAPGTGSSSRPACPVPPQQQGMRHPAAQPASAANSQQQGLPAVLAEPAGASPKRLSSLHRSYDFLAHQMQQHKSASKAAPSPNGAQQAESVPKAAGSAGGPAATLPPAHSMQIGPAVSWDSVYAQLLGPDSSSLASDQHRQLKLLRCMAKSGPVWEHLSADTAQQLAQAIASLLHEGTALKRLLPFLWPLADTSCVAGQAAKVFPSDLRRQLLAALVAYPLPAPPVTTEPQQEGIAANVAADGSSGSSGASQQAMHERRDLLASALRAVWA